MVFDREAMLADTVAPLAASLGLVVWGIEIAGTSRPVARIFVDLEPGVLSTACSVPAADDEADENAQGAGVAVLMPPGVSIEQCTRLSRLVGLALQVDDPFSGEWVLEVSSPGFERPFFQVDQLHPYVGCDIDVVLAAPVDAWPGRKKFSGTLLSVADEAFTLAVPADSRKEDEPDRVDIVWTHVRKATLVHIFPEPGKKFGGSKSARGGTA